MYGPKEIYRFKERRRYSPRGRYRRYHGRYDWIDEKNTKTIGSTSRHRQHSREIEIRKKRPRPEPYLSDVEIEGDNDDHLIFELGQIVLRRYKLIRILGKGTFGNVVLVNDTTTSDPKDMALKIIRRVRKYKKAAEFEVQVLKRIKNHEDSHKHLIVKMLDSFDYHGYYSILFEKLGISVFDFMKRNAYHPYPIEQVQHISFQLINAISFCHRIGIIHTDLKPENILFKWTEYGKAEPWGPDHRNRSDLVRVMKHSNIKIVDMGSAVFSKGDSHLHSGTVTTRHYRSPEVCMGLGFNYPTDIWSIACIIFELFTGITMFQTHDDEEHLAMMIYILGQFPEHMTKRADKSLFHDGKLRMSKHSESRNYIETHCRSFEDYMDKYSISSQKDKCKKLTNLLQDLFQFEPKDRTPLHKAANYPFFEDLSGEAQDRSRKADSGYHSHSLSHHNNRQSYRNTGDTSNNELYESDHHRKRRKQ